MSDERVYCGNRGHYPGAHVRSADCVEPRDAGLSELEVAHEARDVAIGERDEARLQCGEAIAAKNRLHQALIRAERDTLDVLQTLDEARALLRKVVTEGYTRSEINAFLGRT